METTFHLNANELNTDFLEAVKKLFGGKDIIISVTSEADTTEYLLSDPERKQMLLKSIQEVEAEKLISVNLDDFRS